MTHWVDGLAAQPVADKLQDLCHPGAIKDIGPKPLSKLAVIQCVSTKDLHPEFGLDMYNRAETHKLLALVHTNG